MGWKLPSAALLLGLSAAPFHEATAQMNLSGATLSAAPNPTAGTTPTVTARPPTAPRLQAPGPSAVVGRELQFNGRLGLITLESHGKDGTSSADVRFSRLVLPGDSISKPGESCRVEVTGEPVVARHLGLNDGLHQYEAAFKACPFRFSLLDGAILAVVPASAGSCEIPEGDCRITPSGLWGPPAHAMNPATAGQMDKLRVQTEADARAAFRRRLAQFHDPGRIKAFAAEQAGFSSQRQEACADYDGEDAHGYCALHLTQARLFALTSQLEKAQTDSKKPTPGPKPPHQPGSMPGQPSRSRVSVDVVR